MSDTKAGKVKIAGLIRGITEKGQNTFEGLGSDIRLDRTSGWERKWSPSRGLNRT
ncbi:MAG: hypothetical protein JRI32_05355 [Deltaproteobacteria bacterium]|nr:hypothetical protein [Deltaproteobacteria bacterium]